ncbi:hypothetical protein ACFU8W_03220 [Streptomyces sp. NPDC057565]|uniref:hypothetical protein n=1 Tax=Streptomyces sp. NPDC057565 TaxID=3346169 RepID=UPI00369C81D5
MRVLVVEDEVRTAELLRRGLTEEGYAVDVAADGPDAVWQAAEVPYDLIVRVHVKLSHAGAQHLRVAHGKTLSPIVHVMVT